MKNYKKIKYWKKQLMGVLKVAMKGSSDNVWEAFHGPNIGYVEEQYDLFLDDPDAVDETLRQMFEKYGAPVWVTGGETEGSTTASTADLKKLTATMQLVEAIRRHGHQVADIYPVGQFRKDDSPITKPETYGLTESDLKQIDATLLSNELPNQVRTAYDLIQHLKRKYSGKIAYEFEHIPDDEERNWLYNQVETGAFELNLSHEDKKTLLQRIAEVEGFEQFLGKTFVAQKRFSIEGLETMVTILEHFVTSGNKDAVDNIVMGMAHRGRLSVLAHILKKPYDHIFSEFSHGPNKKRVPKDGSNADTYGWSGDVSYHFGAERIYEGEGHKTKLTLAHNPSHLEFVNPVISGYTRAIQDDRSNRGYAIPKTEKAFGIQIHGDAAFIGEGIVPETLNLSRLNGYQIGGSVHIIANNLVGFTTNFTDARSTKYSSDLAKGYEMPIIHVNADDPIACLTVAEFAYQYRKRFKKDIIIDLIGYRRYGHNEMDEPRGTQPLLYKDIDNHPTIFEVFSSHLVSENVVQKDEADQMKESFMNELRDIYNSMKETDLSAVTMPELPKGVANDLEGIDTAVDTETLRVLNEAMLTRPDDFNGFQKLERILKRREKAFNEGEKIDWALGEALAFASILNEGTPIRMSGQDSERGTFAHRHAVLHDVNNEETYSPFHGIDTNASFSIYNSPLSEAGVLGFEYGYSVESKDTLVLWEAQYGDFANTAQVLFDQFISSSRAKWGQLASLVMLLPHGYEGQGPEHSSARLERFLQLSAENNWIVANVTTSGQYFHLLRRQAKIVGTEFARPLVVMTPKSLIRNQRVAVDHTELSTNQFRPILEQQGLGEKKEAVKRLIIGSGKIMIDLEEAVESLDEKDWLHIIRLEQFYPFPEKDIKNILKQYKNVEEIIWIQEDPKNMGGWDFVKERLQDVKKVKQKLRYVGRPYRSSPAVGSPEIHKAEQERIINEALSLE